MYVTVQSWLQVCFRLTYYQGRAGLIGVDAVVGHSQASLGPSAEKPGKKLKAKTAKRKLAPQKGAAAAIAQLAGTAHPDGSVQADMHTTAQIPLSLRRFCTRYQLCNGAFAIVGLLCSASQDFSMRICRAACSYSTTSVKRFSARYLPHHSSLLW